MPRARLGGRDRWRRELPCLLAMLFSLELLVELATSTCYQGCNGNGFCNSDNTCVCQAGFTGADCSERTCPEEVPWFETVDIADAAHNQLTKTECASMGLCNRLDGKCSCFDGFRGPACEIMHCPRRLQWSWTVHDAKRGSSAARWHFAAAPNNLCEVGCQQNCRLRVRSILHRL